MPRKFKYFRKYVISSYILYSNCFFFFCLGAAFREHTQPIMISIGLLNFNQIYTFMSCNYVLKALNGLNTCDRSSRYRNVYSNRSTEVLTNRLGRIAEKIGVFQNDCSKRENVSRLWFVRHWSVAEQFLWEVFRSLHRVRAQDTYTNSSESNLGNFEIKFLLLGVFSCNLSPKDFSDELIDTIQNRRNSESFRTCR